jgi:PGF-pre-PGF domain-containing protein
VRRGFNKIERHFTKKIIRNRLIINFFLIFLLLEFVFLPFTALSSTSLNGLDGNNKTNDSSGDSVSDIDSTVESELESVTDSISTIDSTVDSIVVDDKTYDPNENTKIVEDTTYETDDLETVYDKNYESSGNLLLVDNKPSNSTDFSIIETDKVYYAPNERVVPTEEIISIAENKLGDISSGIEKEVKIEYFKEVESVKLTPVKNLEEVKVTIIKLKDKPEEIVDTPIENTSIYTYLDIKLISDDDYIEEKDIQTLEFKFKVEKAWINSNKIDKSTVKLIRYHDGEWQNLSTTLDTENETCIYYIAESPGCSTFAVVGKKVVEKDEAYGSELTIPWSIIFAFIILLTLILVIIIIKARYIYLKDD